MTYDLTTELKRLDPKIFRALYGNLIEDFIDRSQVAVAATFVPSATGFGVTGGDNLLWFLHPQGMFGLWGRKWRWVGGVRERLFRTVPYTRPPQATGNADVNQIFELYLLRAYRCTLDDYKQLWVIETETVTYGKPKVHNVLALNRTPILFTDPKVAKAIAQLCDPSPPEEVKDLRWVPVTT